MAVDFTSIYGNLLRGPKSVEDYTADHLRNALYQTNLLKARADAEDAQEVRAQRNLLMPIVQDPGFDVNSADWQRKMFATAPRAAYDFIKPQQDAAFRSVQTANESAQGDKLRGETKAVTNKTKRESYEFGMKLLQAADTPEQATELFNHGVAEGYWPTRFAQSGIASIPKDPALYNQWRQRQLASIVDAYRLLPKQDNVNLGGSEAFVSRDPLTGATTVNQSVPRTQTPDNAAELAERRRHNGVIEGQGRVPPGYRATPDGNLEAIPGGPADPSVKTKLANGKPMPAPALKMQQEALDAIGTSGSINADLSAIDQQIAKGELKLSPAANAGSRFKNAVGLADPNSTNFASFSATLEKLRNDSLRLNKGVQTEGDAQRAWDELVQNINDPRVVRQRLAEIRKINERAAALHRMNIDTIRQNYGLEPLDTDSRFNVPPAVGGGTQGGSGLPADIEALVRKHGGK